LGGSGSQRGCCASRWSKQLIADPVVLGSVHCGRFRALSTAVRSNGPRFERDVTAVRSCCRRYGDGRCLSWPQFLTGIASDSQAATMTMTTNLFIHRNSGYSPFGGGSRAPVAVAWPRSRRACVITEQRGNWLREPAPAGFGIGHLQAIGKPRFSSAGGPAPTVLRERKTSARPPCSSPSGAINGQLNIQLICSRKSCVANLSIDELRRASCAPRVARRRRDGGL